jgi:tetratricopeptide (TPR) repeat protein
MNEFADTYYQRASHLADIGRWPEAIKEAGMCLAIEPSHYRALCTISWSHYELGDHKKALEFAEKAIQTDPTQEWAYRLQSAVYSKKNKKKKRLNTALEAVRQEPESTLALQNLTYAQLSQRKFKEARQTAERLRRLAPDTADTHQTFGYVEFNDGKFAEAEESFRRALKIEATDYDSLNMLGETLMKRYEKTHSYKIKRQLLNEAIDCFRQAIVLSPTLQEAKKNLSDANLKSLASHPFSIIPLSLSLFMLVMIIINRTKARAFRPEFLNFDEKLPELKAIYIISGICLMLALFGLAAVFAQRGISDPNKKILEINDQTNWAGKIGLGLMFLVSAFPFYLIIWKIMTNDFQTFAVYTLFDWCALGTGIFGTFLMFFLIVSYFRKN